MNKNTLTIVIFLVSISLSLFVGFFVGQKYSGSKVTANKVIATYSMNGSKKTVELKDVSHRLATDFADHDRMVYQQKRQAILDILGDDIRKANDYSKVEMETVPPEEFDKMVKSLNLDKKKLTDKQIADIHGNLAIAKRNQKIKALVEEQQKKANLQLLMEPPFSFVKPQNQGSLQVLGAAKSPIEFIFYGNMHCPQCATAYQNIVTFESQFPGQLKVYFKYLGLEPDQSIAFQTAKSLYCLTEAQKKEGKVGQLMKAYFAKTPDTMESIMKILAENGLNSAEMEKCLAARDNNEMLRADAKAGQELNQNVAAFFVINNYFVHGAEQQYLVQDLIQYLKTTK